MKKFVIWTSIILAIIIGSVVVFRRFFKKDIKTPVVVEAKIGTIEQIVSATGTVKALKDVNLGFKASGKIVSVNVKIGDSVEAGQDLAGLDTTDLDASAAEASSAVKVAEAQLAEIKAGASQEDIEVQEVAVANAQTNLARVQESADKAIASANAQVASQQVAVSAKKQALEDTENSVENSLNAAYESGLSIVNSKYLIMSNAVDAVNDMFDDNDLTDILGNLNFQSKIDANQAKDDINNVIKALKPHIDAANSSNLQDDTDKALEQLKSSLDSLGNSLETIYVALLNTQSMVNITKAELDAYKTSISAQRTNSSAASASVISAQQSISSAQVSGTASTNAAQQALNSANALLSQYQAALASTQASQAAAVSSAQGALSSAQKQLEKMQSAAKPETVAVYEARLKQSQSALNSILSKYNDRSIISPVSGIITDILKEEGENAAAGEKIISLTAKNGFEIEVDIPESDIVKVGVSNPCDITLDAFSSDKIFKGTVASIYPAESIIDGVVYYKVKIDLSSDEEGIKPGMTANADILTDKKENAVMAPIRLIREKDGKSIVKIQKEDGSIEEREVIKGIRGISGEVEIISGLNGGEKILE